MRLVVGICVPAFALGCVASHPRGGDAGVLDAPRPSRADVPCVLDASEDSLSFAVTDSTGASVLITPANACRPYTSQEWTPASPYLCDDPSLASAFPGLWWHGRVLTVIGTCDSTYADMWARPVVCDDDAECERVLAYLDGFFDAHDIPTRIECRRGLCQHPDLPMARWDLFGLCLAEQPRWPLWSTRRSEESGYVDLNRRVSELCRAGVCSVPPDCRQP